MKRVDLRWHFGCNPCVFIVPSAACGICLFVVRCGKLARPVCHRFL